MRKRLEAISGEAGEETSRVSAQGGTTPCQHRPRSGWAREPVSLQGAEKEPRHGLYRGMMAPSSGFPECCWQVNLIFFLFRFVYFIFGCVGSLLLRAGFL